MRDRVLGALAKGERLDVEMPLTIRGTVYIMQVIVTPVFDAQGKPIFSDKPLFLTLLYYSCLYFNYYFLFLFVF